MLLDIIRKNFWFFIFMLLLGFICIWTTADKSHLPYFLKLHAELFLELYTLCIPLSFLKPKPRVVCQWILSVILYTIAIIDIFCFVRIGSSLSPTIFRLILETTPTEASDFFCTYITPDILFSSVGIVLLLFFCQIAITYFKPYCHIKFHRSLLIPLYLLLIIGVFASIKNIHHIIKTWQFNTINEIESYFGKEYYASRAQYLPIHRLLFSIHADNIAKRQIKKLRTTLKNVQVDSCSFTSPNIILIIGESYNKHHSELYGYHLPTTPYQMSYANNNQLFVFNDAVTPSNITSFALKNAFSLNDLSQHEEWSDYPLFTAIFRKAGYHVAFISNEFIMKQQGDFADFSGSMFINDPEISAIQFDCRNDKLHPFDAGLLDDYRLLKALNTDHNLIIFSLIGQHVDYKNRYPSKHALFTYKDYLRRKDLTKQQKLIVANYDCATRYNDFVINKIIKLFENDDAIILYMPDHGEEVFDELKTFGRLHDTVISKEMAKNEFQIPFWIYCSNRYQELHPIIVESIKNATNRRFFSDDLPHLLLYLGGITCRGYRENCNILKQNFDINRKRLLRGQIDYDKITHDP